MRGGKWEGGRKERGKGIGLGGGPFSPEEGTLGERF